MEEILDNDVAKELFTVLSFCDSEIIKKIPSDFLDTLRSLASNSRKSFKLIRDKSLLEQNISSECKDLLALVYYTYVANPTSKDEVYNSWLVNN